MLRNTLFCTLLFLMSAPVIAQNEPYVHAGEFGLSAGVSHYFGDLNTRAALNRPKLAAGLYYIKQFNNYIGLRLGGNYALVGYSDIYSKNEVQRRRNLSFNSAIWEISASGYFNFFKFMPGSAIYNFTPYLHVGVGAFLYDPYAFLADEKYFLRPLGTEGQGSALYPDRKQYSTTAISFPFGVGLKYSINENMNVFGEINYRFTNTDYLDDVSTTYAGAEAFPADPDGNPSIAYLLQDRSYETGEIIGIKDRQRGNSLQKDAFVTLQLGFSFNISGYKCPKPGL
jgi:opacity protein-like surface antigen